MAKNKSNVGDFVRSEGPQGAVKGRWCLFLFDVILGRDKNCL